MAVPKEKSRQKTTPVSHLYQPDGTIGEIKDAKARDRIAANKADADGKIDALDGRIDNIWNTIYPVGAIYISTVSTSPAALFGGTWERITGRFLLAATDGGAAGGNSNASIAPGYAGGEATHTITVAEMAAHVHSVGAQAANNSAMQFSTWINAAHSTVAGKHWWADTNSVGGNGAHNNMPPYLAVYVWKRVQDI